MLRRREHHHFLGQFQGVEPLEVQNGRKNISLLVEVTTQQGQKSKAIYYPEKGVRFQTDQRIPKPYEVHHHAAFYQLAQLIGVGSAIPAIPFSLKDDDCGSMSPYYEDVKVKPHYYFESLDPNQTWINLAVLDYLSGLVDRTSNDILFLPNGEVIATDNGLSFVEGINFSTQISVIRQAMRGQKIPQPILKGLRNLNQESLSKLADLIYNPEVVLQSVINRRNILINKGVIV